MSNFTVRVVRQTDPGKPVSMRDHQFNYKREALHYIARLGRIVAIRKFGKMWVVTPSK